MYTSARTSKPSIATAARTAFRALLPGAAMLMFAGGSFAATPSLASLNGTYVFHVTSTKEAFWSASKACTNGTSKYTAYSNNWSAYTQLVYGVVTFDGKGHVTSATFTQENKVNQAASDATIVITCTSNGGWSSNGGNIVYDAPAAGTATGTYAVEAAGTDEPEGYIAMTLDSTQGDITFDLDLAGIGTNGVATMVLMRSVQTTSNKDLNTGIAILK